MADERENDIIRLGFWIGEWLAEPLLNRISRGDKDVAVEPKVMDVLVCLAQEPGQTVTKEYFFETLWEGMVVTDDVLSRCISELRKNLGDDSRDPKYIETIRKTGYRLIAPVVIREAGATPDQRRRQFQEESRHQSDRPGGTPQEAKAEGLDLRKSLPVLLTLLVVAGTFGLYTMLRGPAPVSNGATTTPYTSLPGLEIDPAFSPDGQRIAYASDDNGRRDFDIYIKQEGSDKALRLTEDEGDERYPSWSPDGLFVAFVRNSLGISAVFTMPSLGGTERKVADFGSRRVQGVSWSPDGKRLAVSAQREPFGAFSIFLVNVDSLGIDMVTNPPKHYYGNTTPSFSPSGKTIAYAGGPSEDIQDLYIYSLSEASERQITFDSVAISGLDWTPDGKSIVYSSRKDHGHGIWRVSTNGGDPVGLSSAGPSVSHEHPSVAQDGRRLTFARRSASVNIWRLSKPDDFPSLRARPAVFSTHWDSHPDISPNGERIAFASTQSGYREIWIADPDGKNAAQVTQTRGRARSPRWSPSGSELAFQWRQNGQTDVYIVEIQGGVPRRMTTDNNEDTVPMWARDGNSIYFSSNRSGRWELWQISLPDNHLRQVTDGGGRFGMESHDGSSVFFVRPDTSGIWELPVGSDGPATLVFADIDRRDWGNWFASPSGFYFIQRETHSPALSFYGFESKKTTRIKTLDEVPAHPAFSVSQDFSWFVYTQIDEQQSDIMVLEDF